MRFIVVYQREPHARQMAFRDVPQPKDFAERAALAKKALAELKLDVDVWIDDQGDQSRALFGDLPHSAIVLDRAGTVALKLSWCDPEVLKRTLPEVREAVPGTPMAPVDQQFLERITGELPPHHRRAMLAHLVLTLPRHPDRAAWLEELAASGPPQQRAWAERQRRR